MRRTALLVLCMLLVHASGPMAQSTQTIELPTPAQSGEVSLEAVLANRRSVREYPDAAVTLAELSQLLWAAQGITDPQGYRAAPSAGALYPLEVYVAVGDVQGLPQGIYHYAVRKHQLIRTSEMDPRSRLQTAALSQPWVGDAPVVVIFAAVYSRTTQKYGERGRRYVHMEVGHAAQNLFLQAQALHLATVTVGAFEDEEIARILQLPADAQALMLMPIGRR